MLLTIRRPARPAMVCIGRWAWGLGPATGGRGGARLGRPGPYCWASGVIHSGGEADLAPGLGQTQGSQGPGTLLCSAGSLAVRRGPDRAVISEWVAWWQQGEFCYAWPIGAGLGPARALQGPGLCYALLDHWPCGVGLTGRWAWVSLPGGGRQGMVFCSAGHLVVRETIARNNCKPKTIASTHVINNVARNDCHETL